MDSVSIDEKIVAYVRVSRDDLTCENQIKVLKEWAERQGIKDLPVYSEEMSTRKTRPVKEEVLKKFRKGVYTTIIVLRIDRWARSLQELIYNVEEIINNGGRFISLVNGFDFSKRNYNASQQLMLNIFGAFAQFEREIIRERTLEGLARAKAKGNIGGRRKGSKVVPNSEGGFNVVQSGAGSPSV